MKYVRGLLAVDLAGQEQQRMLLCRAKLSKMTPLSLSPKLTPISVNIIELNITRVHRQSIPKAKAQND